MRNPCRWRLSPPGANLGKLAPLSDALYFLAKTLRGLGRYAESLEALEECLAIADEQGDTIRLGLTLKDLGTVTCAWAATTRLARSWIGAARSSCRSSASPMAAMVTQLLGEVALYENKPAEAYRVLAENVLVLRKLNFMPSSAGRPRRWPSPRWSWAAATRRARS